MVLKSMVHTETLLRLATLETTTLMMMHLMMESRMRIQMVRSMQARPIQPEGRILEMKIMTAFKIGKRISPAPFGMLQILILVGLTMVMNETPAMAQTRAILPQPLSQHS